MFIRSVGQTEHGVYRKLLDSPFSVTEERNGEVYGVALPAVGGRPAPVPLIL